MFVTDPNTGQHPVLDHLGFELAGRSFGHPSVKDQTDLVRSAYIQVVSDEAFHQGSALFRLIKNQGPADF